jgi:hypothetical protein
MIPVSLANKKNWSEQMRRSHHDDDDDICKDGEGVTVPVHLMDASQLATRRKFARFTQLTDDEVRLRLHQPGFRDSDACRKAYAKYLSDAGLPQPPDDAIANEKAYETYKTTVGNAWRNPPNPHAVWTASRSDVDLAERVASILQFSRPVTTTSGPPFTDPRFHRKPDGAADRRAAYDQMVRRATEAWRAPVARDGVTIDPDEGSDLLKAIEEAIAKELEGRDRLPRAFDPNAATAVEKQMENWNGRDLASLAADVEKRRAVAHSEFAASLSNAWRSA